MFARRGLFFSVLAIAAIAFYSVSNGAEVASPPISENLFALAAFAASLVALAAIGIALFAMNRVAALRGELRRFSRSVETTLDEIASRSTRDSASIGELNRMVADEIRSMSAKAQAGDNSRPAAAAETRRPRPAPVVTRGDLAQDTGSDFNAAMADALNIDELVVSLQPIISVSRSVAAGFEAHAHVGDTEDGAARDIRRLTSPVSGLDQAGFEQRLLKHAIEAGRRQLGSESEKMPFHVAISGALLGNDDEMQNLAQLTSQHRSLAKSVVLSLDADTFGMRGKVRENLDSLTMEGFRIALEDWAGNEEEAKAAAARGVRYAKVPAGRLFDRKGRRSAEPAGSDLIAALQAADIEIIATGVERDEDAVGLIDLGIDLMEGERFSGPKVLKAPAKRRTELAAT